MCTNAPNIVALSVMHPCSGSTQCDGSLVTYWVENYTLTKEKMNKENWEEENRRESVYIGIRDEKTALLECQRSGKVTSHLLSSIAKKSIVDTSKFTVVTWPFFCLYWIPTVKRKTGMKKTGKKLCVRRHTHTESSSTEVSMRTRIQLLFLITKKMGRYVDVFLLWLYIFVCTKLSAIGKKKTGMTSSIAMYNPVTRQLQKSTHYGHKAAVSSDVCFVTRQASTTLK